MLGKRLLSMGGNDCQVFGYHFGIVRVMIIGSGWGAKHMVKKAGSAKKAGHCLYEGRADASRPGRSFTHATRRYNASSRLTRG